MKGSWSDKKRKYELAPNVSAVINNSNSVIFWVASEIVSSPNLKKRISTLKHFILVASVSCNFFSFYRNFLPIIINNFY